MNELTTEQNDILQEHIDSIHKFDQLSPEMQERIKDSIVAKILGD